MREHLRSVQGPALNAISLGKATKESFQLESLTESWTKVRKLLETSREVDEGVEECFSGGTVAENRNQAKEGGGPTGSPSNRESGEMLDLSSGSRQASIRWR